jgi:hypothetical protein
LHLLRDDYLKNDKPEPTFKFTEYKNKLQAIREREKKALEKELELVAKLLWATRNKHKIVELENR